MCNPTCGTCGVDILPKGDPSTGMCHECFMVSVHGYAQCWGITKPNGELIATDRDEAKMLALLALPTFVECNLIRFIEVRN